MLEHSTQPGFREVPKGETRGSCRRLHHQPRPTEPCSWGGKAKLQRGTSGKRQAGEPGRSPRAVEAQELPRFQALMAGEPGVPDLRHEDRRGRLASSCWRRPRAQLACCATLGWLSARFWLLIKTIQCVRQPAGG